MYSSADLERFYFQYQTEGLPNGISVQDLCLKHKVPYNIFSKWYKDTRKKIVEVEVDGLPASSIPEVRSVVNNDTEKTSPVVSPTRIWVELRGLHIFQKNLSYRDLVHMMEKL